jgi:hypothetical protein
MKDDFILSVERMKFFSVYYRLSSGPNMARTAPRQAIQEYIDRLSAGRGDEGEDRNNGQSI